MDYCTLSDVKLAVPADIWTSNGISDSRLSAVIASKSRSIDTFFRAAGFVLPITAVSSDVTENAVKLVVWEALKQAFFPKDTNTQTSYENDYKEAQDFFAKIGNGLYIPATVTDSAATVATSVEAHRIRYATTTTW